ncbi:unnamed protein product [Prunus armeniaca]
MALILWRFVDGSHPCPSPTLPPSDKSESSTPPSANPDYVSWFQTDQSLISILRATLSESVLSQVIGFSTSKEIWDCLSSPLPILPSSNFASSLLPKEPVSNSDLVTYVLRGLGLDYQMIVTAILNFPPLPSFSDLRTRLLAFEGQHALAAQLAPVASPVAFVVARAHHGPHHSRPRDQPPRSFGGPSPVRHFSGLGQPSHRASRPSSFSPGLLGPPPSRQSIQCWNCNQFSHVQAKCPSPHPFAGMHVASSSDPNWYLDSGATNHMTHDAQQLHSRTSYAPSDQVVVGNGDTLPITHSGNLSFSSGTFVFRLSNVLRVPSLRKNLFSALCKDGLYPIVPTLLSGSKHAFSSIVTSSSLWHRRLGHPSNKVLRSLVSRLSNSPCSHYVWMSPVVSVSGYRYYVLFTNDYTQWVAERKHRHIADMGRTLLHTAHMPHNLWVEAFCTAVSLINRLPTPILKGNNPYKLLFGISPDYAFLRVFGLIAIMVTVAFILLQVGSTPRGLSSCPPTQPVIAINNQESAQPTSGSTSSPSFPVEPSSPPPAPVSSLQSPIFSPSSVPGSSTPPACRSLLYPTAVPISSPPPAVSSPSSDPPSPTQPDCLPVLSQPSVSVSSPPPCSSSSLTVPVVAPPPSQARLSPVHTRSKSGIVKPNPKYHANFSTRYPVPHAFSTLVTTEIEPTCYTQACRHLEWKQAMFDEYHAPLQQGTWTLVPPSPLLNTVGCKWVFRIKQRSDGTIERYKARLVAKGFHQQSGIDYFDTFSHVVKPTTVRTVLCLAISFGWPLRQLDVNNAFLHGSLSENVYMRQPPGFADPHRPNHVCKLHKAIYGLKQAPRAWFQRFSFLLRVGFTQSQADNSMFVCHDQFSVMILLLYVDDIILTGSDSPHLLIFLRTLGTEFDIKDLGRLHYFLGVEVHYHPTSIHLTQNKYTIDLLKRSNLLDCKPVSTPMTSKGSLSRTNGTLLGDPTPYRQMVGALQYLTMTRPDISYAVQHVSQFMGSPRDVHFEAVKRILRYLKGTLGVNLPVRWSPDCSFLVAYSDADWAGCPDTRRSTTGYCVFLGPNLISWSAKKQPTVSRSSAEAEYRALAYACADTLWIQGLLTKLRCPLTHPVLLHCDNLSATYLAANPIFHACTKHIAIDYHFVHERVASGSHKVQFVPSHLQLADVFTKGLLADRFAHLVSKLVTSPVYYIIIGLYMHFRYEVTDSYFEFALLFYFKMLGSGISPDKYTFPSVIKACGVVNNVRLGKAIYDIIQFMGFGVDIFVGSSLIQLYVGNGCIHDAWCLFVEMPHKDCVLWNVMLHGYVKNGESKNAVGMFLEMRNSEIKPNAVTFACILSVCASEAMIGFGTQLHGLIVACGLELDYPVANTLLAMYSKCQCLSEARKLFDMMP